MDLESGRNIDVEREHGDPEVASSRQLALVQLKITEDERKTLLDLISQQLGIADETKCKAIFDEAVDSLREVAEARERLGSSVTVYAYRAVRVALQVHCEALNAVVSDKQKAMEKRKLKEESRLANLMKAEERLQRKIEKERLKREPRVTEMLQNSEKVKWWENMRWYRKVESQCLLQIKESLGIASRDLALLVLDEALWTLGPAQIGVQNPLQVLHTFFCEFERQLMFGKGEYVDHGFLMNIIGACLRQKNFSEYEVVREEIRLRVQVFFPFRGDQFLALVFQVLEEFLDEVDEQLSKCTDQMRMSVLDVLDDVSLSVESIHRSRDPDDPSWMNRVARSYRGSVLSREQVKQLLELKDAAMFRAVAKAAKGSKRRIVSKRLKMGGIVTPLQVADAVRYKRNELSPSKTITSLGTKRGKNQRSYLTYRIDQEIRPHFSHWFEVGDAPRVRERKPIFSGPRDEHVEMLKRWIRCEIDDVGLMRLLKIPKKHPSVLENAKDAIRAAYSDQLKGLRRPKSGLSLKRKVELLARYDADDRSQDFLNLAGVKLQSLRLTAERWRRDIEKHQQAETESSRESQAV